jgi:hypothetical protein
MIDPPLLVVELGRHPSVAVARELQNNPLNRIAKSHVALGLDRGVRVGVEPGTTDAQQGAYLPHRQTRKLLLQAVHELVPGLEMVVQAPWR